MYWNAINNERERILFMRYYLIMGIICCYSLFLNAEELNRIPFYLTKKLLPDKIRAYVNTIQRLHDSAVDHLHQAEELCWYLPEGVGKETVKGAIASACSACMTGSWPRAAAAIVLGTIGVYVSECVGTYMEISEHIRIADKCMEMADSLSAELARKQQHPKWLD